MLARLFEAVKIAFQLVSDDLYHYVIGSADRASLNGRQEITFEEYLSLRREIEIADAGHLAKKQHTMARGVATSTLNGLIWFSPCLRRESRIVALGLAVM